MQCIRDSVVESVISLILESCNHANHATQVQHDCCSGSFQWQAPLCPAGSTVTRAARDRPHLEDASITQLFKSTVRSGSLLGNKRYLARPNSKDVRVGDKLKVVQFHPVIRNNSTPSPKIINFGWHQLGVLWIRNTSISDVRCP